MKSLGSRTISLAFGTVQLGMEYGIANTDGLPSLETATAILSAAAELGIRWLDTARAYGQAERVIGSWMAGRLPAVRPAVVTKIAPLGPDDREAVAQLDKSLEISLATLGLPRVDMVLLHRPKDLLRPGVHNRLLAVRQAGLCDQIGVSVYDPEDIDSILESFEINAVQYPANLLDRRFALSDLPWRLRQRGIMTFVRSAYLQGLLAMPTAGLPTGFEALAPVLDQLDEVAKAHEVTRQSLLLGFAARDPAADHLVVGAERESLLRDTVAAARMAEALPDQLWSDLQALGASLPAWIADPRQWRANRVQH